MWLINCLTFSFLFIIKCSRRIPKLNLSMFSISRRSTHMNFESMGEKNKNNNWMHTLQVQGYVCDPCFCRNTSQSKWLNTDAVTTMNLHVFMICLSFPNVTKQTADWILPWIAAGQWPHGDLGYQLSTDSFGTLHRSSPRRGKRSSSHDSLFSDRSDPSLSPSALWKPKLKCDIVGLWVIKCG